MKTLMILASMLFILTISNSTFAHEGHEHGTGSQPVMNEPMGDQVEVNNTLCPVSGDKIGGKMGKPVKIAYNGKTYNLCCQMCAKDFKKDPEKFSKIAEENARKQK